MVSTKGKHVLWVYRQLIAMLYFALTQKTLIIAIYRIPDPQKKFVKSAFQSKVNKK